MDRDKETDMNSKRIVLVAIAGLLTAVAAACAPTSTAPTQPRSAGAGQPVAAVQSAPICQTGSACQVPTAEQHEIDCVNKMPYTNVLIPSGTSFEVLDKSGDFTCKDSGMVADGKQVITCYGKQLYRFDLKLTNNSCAGENLQTGSGQCQDGYGFDASQQCCAPLGGGSSGSGVISVELGACPLPQVLTPN